MCFSRTSGGPTFNYVYAPSCLKKNGALGSSFCVGICSKLRVYTPRTLQILCCAVLKRFLKRIHHAQTLEHTLWPSANTS